MGSRGASASLNATQASVSMNVGRPTAKKDIKARIAEIDDILADQRRTAGEFVQLREEKERLEGDLRMMSKEYKELDRRDKELNARINEIASGWDNPQMRKKLEAEYSKLDKERTIVSNRKFSIRNGLGEYAGVDWIKGGK